MGAGVGVGVGVGVEVEVACGPRRLARSEEEMVAGCRRTLPLLRWVFKDLEMSCSRRGEVVGIGDGES